MHQFLFWLHEQQPLNFAAGYASHLVRRDGVGVVRGAGLLILLQHGKQQNLFLVMKGLAQ